VRGGVLLEEVFLATVAHELKLGADADGGPCSLGAHGGLYIGNHYRILCICTVSTSTFVSFPKRSVMPQPEAGQVTPCLHAFQIRRFPYKSFNSRRPC
jgi:hypothetical protein